MSRTLDPAALVGLQLADGEVLHLTTPSALGAIVREGLAPRLGPRSALCEDRALVCCFTDPVAAWLSLATWLGRRLSAEGHDEVVVLAVDTRDLPGALRGGHRAWEWTTTEHVAPARCRVLGRTRLDAAATCTEFTQRVHREWLAEAA